MSDPHYKKCRKTLNYVFIFFNLLLVGIYTPKLANLLVGNHKATLANV